MKTVFLTIVLMLSAQGFAQQINIECEGDNGSQSLLIEHSVVNKVASYSVLSSETGDVVAGPHQFETVDANWIPSLNTFGIGYELGSSASVLVGVAGMKINSLEELQVGTYSAFGDGAVIYGNQGEFFQMASAQCRLEVLAQ